MTMNLRADDTFVQDGGWYRASQRWNAFQKARRGQRILFLELGVGYNTPAIIKFPFWKMTAINRKATYACINYGEAAAPKSIHRQSICIDRDIGEVLECLL